MWYAKMYFSGKKEIFEYDAAGVQGVPSVHRELPFLESLLTFQELDCGELIPTLQDINEHWSRFQMENHRESGTAAMVELGELAQKHIYFQLLYVRCYDCISNGGALEDKKLIEELRELPDRLPQYQQQIQRFFDLILDVDKAGRDPQQNASKNYCYDEPNDPVLFPFRPIPLNFEPVEPGRCSPVLYSAEIADMIDYSLRSCVERGITVRRCKNCGRYFAQTGRVSAEYCERPVPHDQQTCREMGAFQQWTKKQTDDPIFKAYRKEYKKRFAWIKAGRITDEAFYAWSEKAREEKKKCDRDIISLEEFQQWLKESK